MFLVGEFCSLSKGSEIDPFFVELREGDKLDQRAMAMALSFAAIIEVYSRLVIGWLMGKEHDEYLVAVVLRIALFYAMPRSWFALSF